MRNKLYIDCTYTYFTDRNSGIQRVVRNIVRNSFDLSERFKLEVLPIYFHGEEFYPADIERLFQIDKPAFISQMSKCPLSEFETNEGDILLLLDWSAHLNFWNHIDDFKQKSGRVISVIYDLVPLKNPETTQEALYISFKNWLDNVVKFSDKVLAISQTVANEVREYAERNCHKKVEVDYFYLGSELDLVKNVTISDSFKGYFKGSSFIMVGSIEPRKNHEYALDAFEILWSLGREEKLVIIGKHGWKNDSLLERIYCHSQFNKKLFVLRDASDDELSFAYENAKGLIFSSVSEGFGLPIVEAFQKKLTVLCSDIPVFREIADEYAIFFKLEHPKRLADKLIDFENEKKHLKKLDQWLNWQESTTCLLKKLTDN